MNQHVLTLLPDSFAVCRLPPDAPMPSWPKGPFVSITRSSDELSIVCPDDAVPGGVRCERGWRCLKVQGPFGLTAVGVLASLVGPLAEAGVSVFVVSTFDTDYILVKGEALSRAIEALGRAGHAIS